MILQFNNLGKYTYSGAAGESRTPMRLPSQVFETCMSANSITAAFLYYLITFLALFQLKNN